MQQTKTRTSHTITSRDVYTPKESFVGEVDGVPTVFNAGKTFVREGHEILSGKWAHLFVPMRVQYDVEAATAAPGELR